MLQFLGLFIICWMFCYISKQTWMSVRLTDILDILPLDYRHCFVGVHHPRQILHPRHLRTQSAETDNTILLPSSMQVYKVTRGHPFCSARYFARPTFGLILMFIIFTILFISSYSFIITRSQLQTMYPIGNHLCEKSVKNGKLQKMCISLDF